MESIPDQLERIEQLRKTGSISSTEFATAKAKILEPPHFATSAPVKQQEDLVHGIEPKTWCMLMHLSLLLGVIFPIVMWAMSKDHSDQVSQHGNRVMNWALSSLIASVVAGMLLGVFIGIPMAMGLLVMNVVFSIIAAMKAHRGELWSYPLAYSFFEEN